MNYYILKLKNDEDDNVEFIDKIESNSLEEATLFFMSRKQMDEETFNKLYKVQKHIQKKRR